MNLSDDLIQKLADEGINWTRQSDGSLSYLAAYEHARAEVNPEKETFVLINEACDPEESGIICERSFKNQFDGKVPSPETVLEDVAAAVGAIDEGIEQALNCIADYDTASY